MADMKAKLTLDARGYRTEMQRVQAESERAFESISAYAQRAGSQMAVDRKRLADDLFDATHDARERELRDLDQYFSDMRDRYEQQAQDLAKTQEGIESKLAATDLDQDALQKASDALQDIQEQRRRNAETITQIETTHAARRAEVNRRYTDQQAADAARAAEAERRAKAEIAADSQRMDDIIFGATHKRRDVDLRDADRYFADLRAKYAGNAEMLAKIEQARQARVKQINDEAPDLGKNLLRGLKDYIPHLGGVAIAFAGLRMAAGAFGVASANAALELARVRGGAEDILRAQLKVLDAQGEMWEGLPLIGGAIRKLNDAWSDRSGLEAQIEGVARLTEAIKRSEELARQWARETAIERARLAGKSEADIARLQSGYAQEDRDAQISAAKKSAQESFNLVARQQEEVQKRRVIAAVAGTPPPGTEWIGGTAQKNLKDAEQLLAQYQGMHAKNVTALKSLQSSANEKTVQEAEAAARKELAVKQQDLDALRSVGETAMEREIREKQEHYDSLLQAAERQGQDLVGIYNQRNAEIAGIEKSYADKIAAEREAGLRKITEYTESEEQKRRRLIEEEYQAALAEARKYGGDVQAIAAARNAKLKDLEADLTAKTRSEYEKRYSDWRQAADKKLSEAEKLQDKLKALESGRTGAQESFFDRTLRMDMEGKDKATQQRMARGAAQMYANQGMQAYAGGRGDMDETRRKLGKAMDYAEQAGDRGAMERIQAQIMKTYEMQKAATEKAFADSKAALAGLSADLQTFKKDAASAKVTVDTSEAEERIKALGVALRKATGAKAGATAGAGAEGLATGGWVSVGAYARGFSDGGSAPGLTGRGTDTIPAWLTPGEFVVRRDAARRNAGLLEAINSGLVVMPASSRRFASGGPVGPAAGNLAGVGAGTVNATITVNALPGQDARDIARAVAVELKRLQARGRA